MIKMSRWRKEGEETDEYSETDGADKTEETSKEEKEVDLEKKILGYFLSLSQLQRLTGLYFVV